MKYSVIIPIYNAGRYLEECINSIINQKREDVEVILVNDGSTDNSLQICNRFKKKYNNIILLNKKNSGSMQAWISGVQISSGEYICFVDADDKVTDNYFRVIDKYVDKGYDIVLYDFYKMYKNSKIKSKVNLIKYGKISQEELKKIQNQFFDNYKNYSLYRWDKVIRANIVKRNIDKIDCRTVYLEDHPISFLNLLSTKSIYYINEPLYYYRVRKSSVTHKNEKRIFEDILKIEEETMKIAKSNNYGDTQFDNIRLYFLYQYARASLKNALFDNSRKIKYKDIFLIKGSDKKIVLFFCKLKFKKMYDFIYKIKSIKNENSFDNFFN